MLVVFPLLSFVFIDSRLGFYKNLLGFVVLKDFISNDKLIYRTSHLVTKFDDFDIRLLFYWDISL